MAWNPSLPATHVEALFDPADANPGSVLLEHFNDPWHCSLDADDEATLRKAAHAYLLAVSGHPQIGPRLHLPDRWLAALAPEGNDDPSFGWMPIEAARPATPRGFAGPRGSFRFRSSSDDLAMLFAAQRLGAQHFLGSGFGLGIAIHLRPEGGSHVATFTGLSATLPHGPFRDHPFEAEPLQLFGATPLSVDRLYLQAEVRQAMAEAGATDPERFVVRGVRIAASPEQWWLERRGIGFRSVTARGPDGRPCTIDVPYEVAMRTTGGRTMGETITHMARLVADAAGSDPRVVDRDPGSVLGRLVRPTRDERPDPPRVPVGLDGARVTGRLFAGGGGTGALEFPPGPGPRLLRVLPCPRFVQDDQAGRPGAARPIANADPTGPQLRSDDASAVQAFFHARELLQRLERYGWTDPADYFRLTEPEIQVYYRSAIVPGPGKDGRTVNARVLPEAWPADASTQPDAGARLPPIQVHLGWADLRRRARAPWVPGGPAAAAVPMGIGVDRRWMWHEFGHVLLLASTGELEFRFAHSAGDAMAAIAADPRSRLSGPLRGLTFPFIHLPRRHDRCAEQGWSWSGSVHRELACVPESQHPRPKGYASEQILSSALFRLYRCIGGDSMLASDATQPDVRERERASHYTLYLVMQAMQLMGDARIQPTGTPARFVHLLRTADRQAGCWTAAFPGRTFRRSGGTLAKVIRWAFEAQGLYGHGDGPGAPEPVDIYIDDGRAGGYAPVSLHWQQRGATDPVAPPWQASPADGIVFPNPAGEVEVRVGNRGHQTAQDVQVTLWAAAWPAGSAAPAWPAAEGVWTRCTPRGPTSRDIAPGPPSAGHGFRFEFAPAPGWHVLFAQAGCADDRAHTDPELALACQSASGPIADLVATDNNLGLRVVAVPPSFIA